MLGTIFSFIPNSNIFNLSEEIFRSHLKDHIEHEESAKATALHDIDETTMFRDYSSSFLHPSMSFDHVYQVEPSEKPGKWWFISLTKSENDKEYVSSLKTKIISRQSHIPNVTSPKLNTNDLPRFSGLDLEIADMLCEENTSLYTSPLTSSSSRSYSQVARATSFPVTSPPPRTVTFSSPTHQPVTPPLTRSPETIFSSPFFSSSFVRNR